MELNLRRVQDSILHRENCSLLGLSPILTLRQKLKFPIEGKYPLNPNNKYFNHYKRMKPKKKKQQRCKGMTKFGVRCRSSATIDGYCMHHWFVARKKYGLKHSQKSRNTSRIKENDKTHKKIPK